MVDFLLELYKLGKLDDLKKGVGLDYSKMEHSYIVSIEEGEIVYSLNTENLMEALEKFYKKEILSCSKTKSYLNYLKESK